VAKPSCPAVHFSAGVFVDKQGEGSFLGQRAANSHVPNSGQPSPFVVKKGALRGKELEDPSLLDKECQKWPRTSFCPTRASKRCFHRILSGLEKGGQFRLLTLTSISGNQEIHRCFRILIKRLRRRGLVKGYIWVVEYTKSGLRHYHVILRGEYVAQALLSVWWQELTGAKVVDIRWVRSKKGMARYLVKYMVKELARYAWGWEWVFRGFCKEWERLKRSCRLRGLSRAALFRLWRLLIQGDPPQGGPWWLWGEEKAVSLYRTWLVSFGK